jgi:hypothetical protein
LAQRLQTNVPYTWLNCDCCLLQEFKPRSAALLHAPISQQQQQQQIDADASQPAAKKQRTDGQSISSEPEQDSAAAAGSSSNSSGSSIGLLLPPGGLQGMVNPHLLLLMNEHFPAAGVLCCAAAAAGTPRGRHDPSHDAAAAAAVGAKRKRPASGTAAADGRPGSSSSSAVAAPAGRHISCELTKQRLFGLWPAQRQDKQDGASTEDYPLAWPDNVLPIMAAAMPLLPDAVASEAGEPGSSILVGQQQPSVQQPGLAAQGLCSASGGVVSLRPAAAQVSDWLVSDEPAVAAPAPEGLAPAAAAAAGGGGPATSQTSGSSSSPQQQHLQDSPPTEPQQQQQGGGVAAERSEAYLAVMPCPPDMTGSSKDQLFKWQEVQLGLQLQLLLPQQQQQQDVPAETAAALAAAAAAGGDETFSRRSFNMEMLYGPGAPESGAAAQPSAPRRHKTSLRSRARSAAAAAAAAEALKLPVLLPNGHCPFCWQLFGSVAALAAHVRCSHDRLGFCCPDASSIQV